MGIVKRSKQDEKLKNRINTKNAKRKRRSADLADRIRGIEGEFSEFRRELINDKFFAYP